MEFGRCSIPGGRSLLAFSLMLVIGTECKSWAQQTQGSSPVENTVPALPAAQPLAQAATRAGTNKTDSAEPAPGATANSAAAANENSSSSSSSSLLKLSSGDLLEVSVYNVPELSTKARVGTSGDVYLPLIDYVHVGDLTVEEAQVLIQKRLEDGGFVHGAHVTIFIDESVSQGVTILGDVARPGIYPALGERKLYDLISAAGGFTPTAGRKVSVVRQHSQNVITLNLPRNLADDLQDNVEIMPGDTITVPRAPIVYVVGDVGHPAGFLVDNGTLTVLQALALAGGTNRTAKMGGARIIRKGPTGMTETKVPLKKMLEAKAPDITLQADDIFFVPLSGARVAGATAFSAAISAATGLAIIAAHP